MWNNGWVPEWNPDPLEGGRMETVWIAERIYAPSEHDIIGAFASAEDALALIDAGEAVWQQDEDGSLLLQTHEYDINLGPLVVRRAL